MSNCWPSYYKDIGCSAATNFLGEQSQCSECPFPVCHEDMDAVREYRNKEIQNRLKLGQSYGMIAQEFNISTKTVGRINAIQ